MLRTCFSAYKTNYKTTIMKLTNEEIARVFAMYWGQECVFESGAKRHTNKGDVLGYAIQQAEEGKCKLLLTPLSLIIDEHAIEIKNILRASHEVWDIDEYTTKDVVDWLLENQLYMYCHCFQQFVIWGYAVPLWLGIDHWANGKTAIELNTAIEK